MTTEQIDQLIKEEDDKIEESLDPSRELITISVDYGSHHLFREFVASGEYTLAMGNAATEMAEILLAKDTPNF